MGVMSTSGFVPLRTSAPLSRVEWELEDDDTVPESSPHNLAVHLIYEIFVAWVERTGLDANVERNIAVRWDRARPKVGVDPDVAIFSPRTPDRDDLQSVKTWVAGHTPPLLAIEVVSESNPVKDYGASPEKYAANGADELWVFDPKLVGPRAAGGPFRLQVWVRGDDGGFERIYAGAGPTRSPRLSRDGADVWIVTTQGGKRLRVADDREGGSLWPTGEERERAEKERALVRVAELEALLAKKP
jgi:Uma2 family endonuclease